MAASWTERLHQSTGSDKPKPSRQEVDDVRSALTMQQNGLLELLVLIVSENN